MCNSQSLLFGSCLPKMGKKVKPHYREEHGNYRGKRLVFFPKDALHTYVDTQSKHKLYSMFEIDHVELYISNSQSQKTPHKITFRDHNKELPGCLFLNVYISK